MTRTLARISLVFVFSCLTLFPPRAADEAQFVATITPLGMILDELTSGCARVHVLLPVGSSPHTYEPRPSDAAAAEHALAMFYVSDALDSWTTRLPARKRIPVFDLIPVAQRLAFNVGQEANHHEEEQEHADAHDHGDDDPHFWSDPLAVRSLLGPLAEQLAQLDPAQAAAYRANATWMSARMTALDAELKSKLEPVRGKGVILFHPSLCYMLRRYQIQMLGVIVAAPGKEPTPRELQRIGLLTRQNKTKALFTEPQLPRRPAEIIAENTGCRLYELDPNGGTEGRRTLEELLRYNAGVLREALQ